MAFQKLGVITDEVSQQLPVALKWAKENALSHVELRMINGKNIVDLSNEALKDIRQKIEEKDLFVSCIASPVFKCPLDPSRPVAKGDTFGESEGTVQDHFSLLDRTIEICQIVGTKNIRIFSFWREQQPEKHIDEIVSHLKEAAKIAKKNDIQLLLENEGTCNGGSAKEVAAIVKKVNDPSLKILWDPGNEAYDGRSAYPEGYEYVKDWIGHVHLKDAIAKENWEGFCVPIGEGNVPFAEQLEALAKDEYEGLYTLETHYIPEGGTAKDGSTLTIQGLKNMLRE